MSAPAICKSDRVQFDDGGCGTRTGTVRELLGDTALIEIDHELKGMVCSVPIVALIHFPARLPVIPQPGAPIARWRIEELRFFGWKNISCEFTAFDSAWSAVQRYARICKIPFRKLRIVITFH